MKPGYWREWRAAHPEYRDRERLRRRKDRAEGRRGDRKNEYRNRALKRVQAPLEATFIGHSLFDQARSICGERPFFRPWDWEDQMGQVVLALLEGQDPAEAARLARKGANIALWMEIPIPPNADVRHDGRLVLQLK